MKPPFPYYGGKMTIASRIAAALPTHDHYVEAYAGSLAVLLAKTPAKMETVNDLDRAIVTLWRVLRDQPDDLIRACALTPHSRAEHADAVHPDERNREDLSDLETARRVWVRLTQGRSGAMAPTGWRYYQNPAGSSTSFPRYMAGYVDRMPPAAQRIAAVSLECRPAVEMVEVYGQHAGVLIYADPPYPYSTRTGGSHYRHEMGTEKQHRELAEALHGAVASVVLSGYDCPLYDELYAGWERLEISAFTGNGGTRKTGSRTEVLWSNRAMTQQMQFEDAEATA